MSFAEYTFADLDWTKRDENLIDPPEELTPEACMRVARNMTLDEFSSLAMRLVEKARDVEDTSAVTLLFKRSPEHLQVSAFVALLECRPCCHDAKVSEQDANRAAWVAIAEMWMASDLETRGEVLLLHFQHEKRINRPTREQRKADRLAYLESERQYAEQQEAQQADAIPDDTDADFEAMDQANEMALN